MFLIVSRGGSEVRILPLGEGTTPVGSQVGVGVQLDDAAISPRHLEIRVEGGRVAVEASPGAPSFVYGGDLVQRADLADGDEVEVGPYALRVAQGDGRASAIDEALSGGDEEAMDDALGLALGNLFDDDAAADDDEGSDEDDEDAPASGRRSAPLAPPVSEPAPGSRSRPGATGSGVRRVAHVADELASALAASAPQVGAATPAALGWDDGDDEAPAEAAPALHAPVAPAPTAGGAGPVAPAASVGGPSAAALSSPAPSAPAAQVVRAREIGVTPGRVVAPVAADAARTGPRLVTRGFGGGERILLLGEAPVFIGSAQGMDITVDHPEIGRRHAAIVPEGDGFVLRDLQATGLTSVNGTPTNAWRLRAGDRIRIGGVDIQFHWEDQPAASRAAAGSIAPVFEEVEEEQAPRRGRWAAVGLGVVLLGAVAALLFSPDLGRLASRGAPTPVPALAPEVEASLSDAVAVAGALLGAGRHEAARRGLEEAEVRAGVRSDPRVHVLLGLADEQAVSDAIWWSLWSGLAIPDTQADRVALLLAEGRWHLAVAEKANLRGDPYAVVEALAARAQMAYKTAQKLAPADTEAKKGLASTQRLVGMARVREDDLASRLQKAEPGLLLDSARAALRAGQLRQAQVILSALAGRTEPGAAALRTEVDALIADTLQRIAAVRRPLVAAGDAARDGGRLVEARTLFEAAQIAGPEDQALTQRLANLEPLLQTRAQESLSRAQELEKAGSIADATLLYRQVLEYVPDRTQSVYGEARARLEAIARAGGGAAGVR